MISDRSSELAEEFQISAKEYVNFRCWFSPDVTQYKSTKLLDTITNEDITPWWRQLHPTHPYTFPSMGMTGITYALRKP